jgi:hypothetical protein
MLPNIYTIIASESAESSDQQFGAALSLAGFGGGVLAT